MILSASVETFTCHQHAEMHPQKYHKPQELPAFRVIWWRVVERGVAVPCDHGECGSPDSHRVTGSLYSQVVTLADLMKRIDPMHARLTLELLDILQAASFIECQAPGSFSATEVLGSSELLASIADIGAHKRRLETEVVPDLAANVELVWVCMQALPDILTGALQQCTSGNVLES